MLLQNLLKCFIAFAILFFTSSVQGQFVVSFDEDGTANATTGVEASVISSVSDFSRGPGVTANNGGNFNTKGWVQSLSFDEDDYLSCSFNTSSFVELSQIAVKLSRSNTGPGIIELYFSQDGFSTAILLAQEIIATSGTEFTASLTQLPTNITGPVEFRIYGFSATSQAGTSRLENRIVGSTTGTMIIEGIVKDVARIGQQGFLSLTSAVDAAVTGETVVLLDDVIDQPTISIDEAIILDGGDHTITSNSPSYGIYVNSSGVTVKDVTVDGAGTFGLHTECGSDNLALENVTSTSSGGSGFTINGSDGVTLTDITSTMNGGNGVSITNCTNLSITNITTSGNSFGTFSAGVGIFTSDQFCPGGGVQGTTSNVNIGGTVSIGEPTTVYEQGPVGSISGTVLPPAVASHFLGISGGQRYYAASDTDAFGAAKAVIEGQLAPADDVYVTEVATGERLVKQDLGGGTMMTIAGALKDQVSGSSYVVRLLDGTYNGPLSDIAANITLKINSGATYNNTALLKNLGVIDITAGGAFSNTGTYGGSGTFIGNFINNGTIAISLP